MISTTKIILCCIS